MSAEALSSRRRVGHIYALEAKYEFLKLLRMPMYAIPTLAFPLVFYLLFGVAMGSRWSRGFSMAKDGLLHFEAPSYPLACRNIP